MNKTADLFDLLEQVFDGECERVATCAEYDLPPYAVPLAPEEWRVVYAGPANAWNPWSSVEFDEADVDTDAPLCLYVDVKYASGGRALYGSVDRNFPKGDYDLSRLSLWMD